MVILKVLDFEKTVGGHKPLSLNCPLDIHSCNKANTDLSENSRTMIHKTDCFSISGSLRIMATEGIQVLLYLLPIDTRVREAAKILALRSSRRYTNFAYR